MAKQMRKAAVCCRSEFACCAQVSVLEMDGQFDKIEELIYVESHLSNTSAKFYGEITQQMLKNSTVPGLHQRHRPVPDHCRPQDP